MEKIDAHQHFWRYDTDEYPWIDGRMESLKKDHLPRDLEKAQSELGFNGSIAVQARQSIEETRWLLQLADDYDQIKGVVGWVDLKSNKVDECLSEFTEHPRFVGVRHVVQDESDDRYILRPDFLNGISKLNDYNLTYDILIYPKQLSATLEFVKEFPDQPLVLDHIAKPDIKTGAIEPWATQIRELASHANVHCKISGMVTEADWWGWKPEQFDPYLNVIFKSFRPERLMIGSDWPVCRLAGEYTPVMQLAIDFMQANAPDYIDEFLGGNALAFYCSKH